ncbi:hypothetical protein SAMN05519103_01928 [Rhizobiales bacterium GAS113]|nr:hypothetical protein SAMN05519103_01928 [Rhizobiales bacterium GAS113]
MRNYRNKPKAIHRARLPRRRNAAATPMHPRDPHPQLSPGACGRLPREGYDEPRAADEFVIKFLRDTQVTRIAWKFLAEHLWRQTLFDFECGMKHRDDLE